MSDHVKSTIKDQQLLAQKRLQLIEEAAKLFRSQGFDRTTIPQIAAAAGMSVGSIYRYVSKKDDIMYLLLQQVSEELEQEIYTLANVELPPFEKLYTLMSRYYRFIDAKKDLMHVALRDMRMVKGFRTALQRQEACTVACFQRVLEEGMEAGVFAPIEIELFAYDLVFIGHMWVIRAYRFKERSIDDYAAKQYEFIRRALTHHSTK